MAGDDTAGAYPGIFLIAQSSRFCVQNSTDGFVHERCVDEVEVFLAEIMLLGKFPQENRSQLCHGTTVLLAGNQSAVDNLDAGMQIQQIAYQSNSVAAAAAGTEIVQIFGNEAHFRLQGDFLSLGSSFLQRCFGMLLQPVGGCDDNSALADGYMLGIYKPDIARKGLIFQSQFAAMIGAGGERNEKVL